MSDSYLELLYYVYLDDRTTKHTPENLRLILNRGALKNYKTAPFKTIQFQDSSVCNLVQITDILTGAIAYKKNGKDEINSKSNTKLYKDKVCHYVLKKAGIRTLDESTPAGNKHFSLWNMQLKPR